MGESLEQAKNRAARAIAEPDWLASGRARYLHDADFHAVVEVVCQERYGDIRSKLATTEAALADAKAEIERMKAACHHGSQTLEGEGLLRCELCGAVERDPLWRNPA